MAIYSFQHDYISLNKLGINGEKLGKGRAAAGVEYITRASAEYVRYVGFTPNKHMAKRQMQAIEDAMPRKDARITHTFIIALPVECTKEQRRLLTNKYAWTLTNKGRSPGIFAVHTDKAHNPHLHITFPDREVTFVRDDAGKLLYAEVGPSVQKLTAKARERAKAGLEPNATHALRIMWRDVANKALEEFGYEARIDNRTLLEQGIARQAEKHRGPISREMHIADTPVDLPHAKSEIVVEQNVPEPATIRLRPEDYIRGALSLDHDIKWAKATQQSIKNQREYAQSDRAKAAAYREAGQKAENLAIAHRNASRLIGDELAPLLNADGSYKGFRVTLFGHELATPKYRKAESLDLEKRHREYKQSEAQEWADTNLNEGTKHEAMALAAEKRAEATERDLNEMVAAHGNDATIDSCIEDLNEAIATNLRERTPNEIVSMHEIGELTAEEAVRTLELMGQEHYITRIEMRDRQEQEVEGNEPER